MLKKILSPHLEAIQIGLAVLCSAIFVSVWVWVGYAWGHSGVDKARKAQVEAEAARDSAVTARNDAEARNALLTSQLAALNLQAQQNVDAQALRTAEASRAAQSSAETRALIEQRIRQLDDQVTQAIANPDCMKILEANVCGIELH